MDVENTVRDKVIFPEIEDKISLWNPYLTWSVLIAYLSFTKLVGPTLMKNRKPYNLQLLMILYNGVMVLCNLYLSFRFTELLIYFWPFRCNIKLSPLAGNPVTYMPISRTLFYVKFLELFDTVLFILRKKNNQVSFLHVFHHSLVFVFVWVGLTFSLYQKYYLLLACSINCSVHVVLYLYYGLSAMGPNVRKYMWWKRYLTTLQIMQFMVVLLYMLLNLINGCEKFTAFDKIMCSFIVVITILFFNFYIKSYKRLK